MLVSSLVSERRRGEQLYLARFTRSLAEPRSGLPVSGTRRRRYDEEETDHEALFPHFVVGAPRYSHHRLQQLKSWEYEQTPGGGAKDHCAACESVRYGRAGRVLYSGRGGHGTSA